MGSQTQNSFYRAICDVMDKYWGLRRLWCHNVVNSHWYQIIVQNILSLSWYFNWDFTANTLGLLLQLSPITELIGLIQTDFLLFAIYRENAPLSENLLKIKCDHFEQKIIINQKVIKCETTFVSLMIGPDWFAELYNLSREWVAKWTQFSIENAIESFPKTFLSIILSPTWIRLFLFQNT